MPYETHYLTVVPEERTPEDWKTNPEAVKWYEKKKKVALDAFHNSTEPRKTQVFRRKLIGYSTTNTWPFYKSLPYTPFSLMRHIDDVSRERFAYTPKATPKKYWDCEISPAKNDVVGVWEGPKPKVFRRLWSKPMPSPPRELGTDESWSGDTDTFTFSPDKGAQFRQSGHVSEPSNLSTPPSKDSFLHVETLDLSSKLLNGESGSYNFTPGSSLVGSPYTRHRGDKLHLPSIQLPVKKK